MEMIQRPARERQAFGERRSSGINNIITLLGQQVLKNQMQKDMETKISEAEKAGKRISYSINPNTGQLTPTISSQDYSGVFEALKNPDVSSKYELGVSSKGEPRLIKKKQIKPNVIAGIQSALASEDSTISMKNPATGEIEDLDISDEKNVDKAMSYLGIENWRDSPELIEAGIPGQYDTWKKTMKEKTEQAKQNKEQKIQPFAKGLKRIGGLGARYKEASDKYGEEKAKQIVEKIMELQKTGKSLEEIKTLLEDAKVDANVFLKFYK